MAIPIEDFDAGAYQLPEYAEALTHLYGRLDSEGLDPLKFATIDRDLDIYGQFLSMLGEPHKAVPFVHVTGTRGKGSTVIFLESILKRAGYHVGATVSPHLIEVRERIRFGGYYISREDFAEYYNSIIKPVADLNLTGCTFRTVFELLIALAFVSFREKNVDLALLEVGMGGRKDATNVVDPLLSVITRIGLDHTHVLGNTFREIAWDKGHIIKPERPAIIGAQPAEALDELEKRAKKTGSELWRLGYEFDYNIIDINYKGVSFNIKTPISEFKNIKINMLGRHQAENAATAIAAIDRLRHDGKYDISDNQIIDGLSEARWEGRAEVICQDPQVVIDGAHTPQGALAMNNLVKDCWAGRDITLILGFNKDKDVDGFLDSFDFIPTRVIATEAKTPRAMKKEHVAELARKRGWEAEIAPVETAIHMALDGIGKNGTVLATGSLYIVGAVRRYWLQGSDENLIFENSKD